MLSSCQPQEASSDEAKLDSLAAEIEKLVEDSEIEPTRAAEIEEPEDNGYPKEKPKADLEALRERRKTAFKDEKNFFETPRIESWISKLKIGEDEDGMPEYGKLETGKFHQLTSKEGFYYYFVHPELWDQICAETAFEAGDVMAISQNLPWTGGGDYPSEKQTELVKSNMEEIEGMILNCLEDNQQVSPEMMAVIVELEMKSAVPVLLKIFERQSAPKDDLILTTLVTLMNHAKFPDWQGSDLDEAFGEKWYESIELNETNVDKICYFAKKFGES